MIADEHGHIVGRGIPAGLTRHVVVEHTPITLQVLKTDILHLALLIVAVDNRQAGTVVLLPDGRYLLCDSLSTLGYFLPAKHQYAALNEKLRSLRGYRHLVEACVLDRRWTVVYAQNGCAAEACCPSAGRHL